MATLLERLQQRLSSSTPTMQPQQAVIMRALQTRQGKAAPATGAAAPTNLGEQAAVAESQSALNTQTAKGGAVAAQVGEEAAGVQAATQQRRDELASQRRTAEAGLQTQARVQRGELANTEDLASQERDLKSFQKLSSLTQQADQAVQKLTTDRGISEDQLFGQFRREGAKLQTEQERAGLEQALFSAMLSNKKYLQEIEQTGEMRRLDNQQQWAKELQDIVYGKELSSILYDTETKELVDDQGRNWEVALEKLDQKRKWQIYEAAAKNAEKRLMNYGIIKGALGVTNSASSSSGNTATEQG